MTRTTYHFTFLKSVPMDAVEDALVLAVLAAEAIHDGDRAVARAVHLPESLPRVCVIDARTNAGRTVLRVFFAYVTGMFGVRAFRVVTTEDLERRAAGARGKCRHCARRAGAGR